MSDVPRRLLRDALHERLTPEPASSCLDAETLAAWSEGTLGAHERAAVESHASDCARCQALLAAMVRSEEAAVGTATADVPWWRTWGIGWLVPLTAAAAAVVLWINVPQRSLQQSAPESQPPLAAVTPAPGARDSMPAAKESAAPAKPAPPASQPLSTAAKPSSPAATRSAPAALPRAPASASAEQRPEAPAPTPTESALTLSERARAAQAATPLPEAPIASPLAARAYAPMADRAAAAAGGGGGRAEAAAKSAVARADVVSTDPAVRWRLLQPGTVDRSIDGGRSWQTQPTGVSAMMSAGTAPSPSTCWLVGPAGIVLLSTDGRTWQRIAFPEAVDLRSVHATDALNATVTAADGRTFTTSDGGKTWRRE